MKLTISNLALAGLTLSHNIIALHSCETKLVVFGDSLTDNGNLFGITEKALPPAVAYFEGRFTNGRVWVEFLAEAMGLAPPTPRYPNLTGTNYAVAGAATGNSVNSTWTSMLTGTEVDIPAKGIRLQVDDFVTDLEAGMDWCMDSPVFLWGGAADTIVLGNSPAYENIIDNLEMSIETLIGAGVTNIAVLNLPPLFASPAATGTPSLFVQATLAEDNLMANILAYNEELVRRLNDIESAYKCVNIQNVDTFSIIGGVAGDPLSFGIEGDFTLPVLNETALHLDSKFEKLNVDNAFWYDGVHPTETVHKVIAGEFFKVTNNKVGKKAKKGKNVSKQCKESKTKKGSKTTKREKATKEDKSSKAE